MGGYWSRDISLTTSEDFWKRIAVNETVYSLYPGSPLNIINDPHNAFLVHHNETRDHLIALRSNSSWYILRIANGLVEISECADFLMLLVKEVSSTKTFTIRSCLLSDHRLYKILGSIDNLTINILMSF